MAPPGKSITDFFKPRPQNSQSTREQPRTQLTDSRGARQWPSPRIDSRIGVRPNGPSPLPTRTINKTARAHNDAEPESPTSYKTFAPSEAVDENSRPPNSSSSLPHASQISLSSAVSHRIVKNGEQVVTNSDSETETSDDDLLSLDFRTIKAPVQQRLTPGSMKTRTSGTPSSLSVIGNKRAYQGPLDGQARRPAPSLNFLIEQTRKDAEREQKIARVKASVEEPIQEEPPPQEEKMDEAEMAAVLQADEGGDNAERVLLAMRRTNALQLSCVWRGFDEKNVKRPPKRHFPSHVLRQSWAASFKDSERREQAFLSGYAHRVFQCQELPEELAEWMIDQLLLKPRDALNVSYLAILAQRSQHIGTLLSAARIAEMFRTLGAKEELTGTGKIVPIFEPPRAPVQALPSPLKWILLLLHEIGPSLSPESKLQTLSTLMIMTLEYNVLANAEIIVIIQEAMPRIMASIPESDVASVCTHLISTLLDRVNHAVLQNNLVGSLPTNSPFMAYFQRQLALAFFFHPTRINLPLDSPSLPELTQSHIRTSPKLRITQDTDYASLAALISLLDTAIGPGFTSIPYLPPPITSSAINTMPAPLPPISPEEKEFNIQVDALAHQIRLLSNDIVEVGALSNPAKMDAKERSERLVHRLQSTVRTRGRARKVFGDVLQEDEGGKVGIGKWFGRRGGAGGGVGGGSANGNVV